jgi:tetratricopeptide (TPR) repeat protein
MKLARCCGTALATLVLLTIPPPGVAATGVERSLGRYADFARSLEARAGQCDLGRLDDSISVEDLMQRGTGDLTVPARVRAGFLSGFKSKLSLGGQICDSLQESGSYEMLRIRRVDGQPRALFRMISNSGLNYHDFLLAIGSSGGVQIVDFYNYLSGEWFSITLRRSFLPLVAGSNQSLLARLTRGESAYVTNVPKILEMQRLHVEGNHDQALAIFDAFPEELKRDKNLLLIRFNVAAQAGDEAYQAAMFDLKKRLPDDPALDFALIDHYFYAKQFDKALEIIDNIDKKVEGDPYLDFFRANILYTDGNWVGAKRFARQAIDREPDLEDPYWTLITISLDERDYTETARLLTAVEDSLGFVIGDLIDIPEYAGFRESEQYRRWLLRD